MAKASFTPKIIEWHAFQIDPTSFYKLYALILCSLAYDFPIQSFLELETEDNFLSLTSEDFCLLILMSSEFQNLLNKLTFFLYVIHLDMHWVLNLGCTLKSPEEIEKVLSSDTIKSNKYRWNPWVWACNFRGVLK